MPRKALGASARRPWVSTCGRGGRVCWPLAARAQPGGLLGLMAFGIAQSEPGSRVAIWAARRAQPGW